MSTTTPTPAYVCPSCGGNVYVGLTHYCTTGLSPEQRDNAEADALRHRLFDRRPSVIHAPPTDLGS